MPHDDLHCHDCHDLDYRFIIDAAMHDSDLSLRSDLVNDAYAYHMICRARRGRAAGPGRRAGPGSRAAETFESIISILSDIIDIRPAIHVSVIR